MAAIDRTVSPTLAPALTIGIGLGGFVDGIVAHQILGWHHMLSARTGDMRTNEVADGLFHAGAWVIVLAGILWLYARLRLAPVPAAWPRPDVGPRPWRALLGPLLAGWGVFNIVEGIVDHHVLNLHHVRPGGFGRLFRAGAIHGRWSILPFHHAAPAPKRLVCYRGDIGVTVQHVGVLVGRHAHRELWPVVLQWIDELPAVRDR